MSICRNRKLLQLDAQNNADATMATLDAVLGLDHEVTYQLVDDSTRTVCRRRTINPLIQTALAQRPDLQSLTFGQQSAQKFARAQWDQMLPSVTAAGTVGSVPIRVDQYYLNNWWGAIGVNVNVPIFNGFLYSSEAKEARYRAAGGCGADARSSRSNRARCAHSLAAGKYGLPKNRRDRRVAQASQHGASVGANTLSAGAQFDCRAQPGTAATDDARPLTIPTLNMSTGWRWPHSTIR